MRNSYRLWFTVLLILTLIPVTSGCMYRKQMDQQAQSPVQVKEAVMLVQQAVNDYRDKTGVLPLKSKPAGTPVYERYVLDFTLLLHGGYLGSIPGVAYEKGGAFVFVMTDDETKPSVKLLDIAAVQEVGEIQNLVRAYQAARGSLPIDVDLANGFYTIDYQLLKTDVKQISSRYSALYLGLMMDADGNVFIDYAPDIMKQIQAHPDQLKQIKDGRKLLVDNSYFVPVLSVAYEIKNNEPVPIPEEK